MAQWLMTFKLQTQTPVYFHVDLLPSTAKYNMGKLLGTYF